MVARMAFGLFLTLNSLSSIQAASYEEVNIAILDFEGAGLGNNEVVMVSDKFRCSLFEFSKYRIMERASMNDVLKEQGFQQTGACNSNTCLVEAGQLLGVSYMLAGRLSRANGLTAVSVRIIDVGTGEILLAKSREYQSQFQNFVSMAVPAFAKELIAAIDQSLKTFAERHKKGILFIESEPENGSITIDGLETGRTTPTTFKEIDAGQHAILVNSGSRVGSASVNILSGKLERCVVTLQKGFGVLRIQGAVPGLSVEIANIGKRTTPVEIDSVPAGDYSVNCTHEGFFPFMANVEVSALKTTDFTINLEPLSYLRILGLENDSRVELDGKVLKPIDSLDLTLPPGAHVLRVQRQGYHPSEQTLVTTQGATTVHLAKYAPLPAWLTIASMPTGAIISLNGQVSGRTPGTFTALEPGLYKVVLRHDIYEPVVKDVTIRAGEQVKLAETFTRYTEEYKSWKLKQQKVNFSNLALAGTGQLALHSDALGLTLLVAGIGSDAFLAFSVYQLSSHSGKANDSRSQTEKAYYECAKHSYYKQSG